MTTAKQLDVKVNVFSTGSGVLDGLNKRFDRLAYATKRFDNQTGRLVTTFRTFKMEMLSVMFFGMAIQNIFGGFISKVLETLGVFELLNAAMGEFLYPVLIPLAEIFYQLFEIFMNLPEPVKAFIGTAMILTTVFGAVLFAVGTLSLGLAGLGLTIGAIALPIIAIVAVIAGWIAIMMWLESEFGVVTKTTQFFGTVWGGVWNAAVTIFQMAFNIFFGIFNAIFNFFAGIVEGVTGVKVSWQSVWGAIVGFFQWAWGVIEPIFGSMMWWLNTIKDAISWALDGLNRVSSSAGKSLGKAVGSATGGKKGDFIWRPNGPPINFDAQDTIMGFKAGNQNAFNNSVNINANISSDYDIYDIGKRISESQRLDLTSAGLI